MRYEQRRIQALVRQATKIRGSRSGDRVGRWPAEFKVRVVGLMNGGVRVNQLETALKIHFTTLMAWRRELKAKRGGGSFKTLKVVDGPKPKSQSKSPVKIFVTTSHGSEIHGLDADEVAQLIRRGVL